MSPLMISFIVLQLISSLFLIAVILLQSGKRSGLSGAISGAAETFLSKTKARTWDARLSKMTKWVAIGYVVLTLGLNILE
jgi:preprotein translocase subunit SecG